MTKPCLRSLTSVVLSPRTQWQPSRLFSHRRGSTCRTIQLPPSCSTTCLRQLHTQPRREQALAAIREHPELVINRAGDSAKLAALHARLSLPPRFSTKTLARCLIHPTANSDAGLNNASLALLGQQLLAYYTAEWLMCNYPRLPMPILFAAEYAYTGSRTLASVCREWGVDAAAAPAPNVDAGLLQFQRREAGNAMADDLMSRIKDHATRQETPGTGRPNDTRHFRRGISSRIVYDDECGNLRSGVRTVLPQNAVSQTSPDSPTTTSDLVPADLDTTLESASAQFIRAVFGALYLYSGAATVHSFHEAHILSRHLALHTLFDFKHPTRDLSRLCARESLEPPVARLLSETGRHSRSPVFVVGVFSGEDKLGEGSGASLDEARVRAAAAALRGWYLYSPPPGDVRMPSRQREMAGRGVEWKPQVVDIGEIVT